AGCGLLPGLGQLRGAGGNPPAMFLLGFLPVLICAGWIIVAAEPHGNWFRNHVTAWSSDIGVFHVVRDIATFNGVLAFGIGLVFAYTLEPAMLGRRRAVVATDAPVAGRRPLPIARTAAAGAPPARSPSRAARRSRARAEWRGAGRARRAPSRTRTGCETWEPRRARALTPPAARALRRPRSAPAARARTRASSCRSETGCRRS